MKAVYLILTLTLAFASSACVPKEQIKSSKSFSKTLHNGQASATDLLVEMGAPQDKTPSATVPDVTAFKYKNGESFQVENQKVTAHFRDPNPEELSLNYWRNQFKDVPTTFRENSSSTPHEKIYELQARSLGTSILYNDQNQNVFRVIEYANQ